MVPTQSPNGFSFHGLADIVREFRELIKDVWYRNNQEMAQGELDLMERYASSGIEHDSFLLSAMPSKIEFQPSKPCSATEESP